jgi:hypothetical protein
MNALNVIIATVIVLVGAMSADAQTTLYVNGSTGNDSVSKANNSPSTPWRTIGRAAWGGTNRAAPNASEAAASGNTVMVAGGTYSTTVAVGNRWSVVYNPANSGTSANPITFTCSGQCVLGAPNADAPIIGADARNYIKWYADIAQGNSWMITAYGRQSGSATATQVNTAPDTGPVVCHAATGCWIEGAQIDGGLQTDYTDNWNAVRVENCTSCVIRNNSMRNFRNMDNTSNGTAVTLYGSASSVVEHNYVTNVGSAIMIKDSGSSMPQNNLRVRFNRFDGADRCFGSSTTSEARNYIYQNLCMNAQLGLYVTGGGLSDDWIFNNTFYNLRDAGVYLASNNGSGGRFWNNIILNADRMIMPASTPMPAEQVIDLEHNLYQTYSLFYSGSDGTRTFAAYRTAYPMHDQSAPASVNSNPLFVNPAAGDFRLCTGAGAPASGCTGASPAISLGVDLFDLDGDLNTTETLRSGAYLNNTEEIGISGLPSGLPRAPTNLRLVGQ